jgi:hypothetical protein
MKKRWKTNPNNRGLSSSRPHKPPNKIRHCLLISLIFSCNPPFRFFPLPLRQSLKSHSLSLSLSLLIGPHPTVYTAASSDPTQSINKRGKMNSMEQQNGCRHTILSSLTYISPSLFYLPRPTQKCNKNNASCCILPKQIPKWTISTRSHYRIKFSIASRFHYLHPREIIIAKVKMSKFLVPTLSLPLFLLSMFIGMAMAPYLWPKKLLWSPY